MMRKSREKAYQPRHMAQVKRPRLYTYVEWLGIVILGFFIAVGLRTYVVESYVVPTGSMLDTIQLQDHLLGEKITLRSSAPKAGDIITFPDPENPRVTLIKRVIAVGGQAVDIRDNKVFVDGHALSEPYTQGKPTWTFDRFSRILKKPIRYPYKVPLGRLWVMGDNRTNSLDSRYFGSIPEANVDSKIFFRYWPLDRMGALP